MLTFPNSNKDSSAERDNLKFHKYFTIYIAESNFLVNMEPLGYAA